MLGRQTFKKLVNFPDPVFWLKNVRKINYLNDSLFILDHALKIFLQHVNPIKPRVLKPKDQISFHNSCCDSTLLRK